MSAEMDRAQALLALAMNNGNVKKTATENGLSTTTLRRWRDEQEDEPDEDIEELINALSENELETARQLQKLAAARIIGKMATASVRDAHAVWKDSSAIIATLEGRKKPEQVHRHIIESPEVATQRFVEGFAEIERTARARATLVEKYQPESIGAESFTVDGEAVEDI